VSACRTYQRTRKPAQGGSPSTSCSVDLGGCDAGTVAAVHDVEQAIAQPQEVAAFAGSTPIYGDDKGCTDWPIIQITLGTRTIRVADDCLPSGVMSCNHAVSCVPVPAAVRALVNVLVSVDQASIKQGECATVFP